MSAALSNRVLVEGLCDFIQTSGTLVSRVGKEKWVQIHLKILVGLCQKMFPSTHWHNLIMSWD